MPLKSGRSRRKSARTARSVQPTSVTDSCVTRLRTPLAIFEEIFRTQVSCLLARTPFTTSKPSILSSSLGMSAGSFWRSASIGIRTRPRAASMPAAMAAVCP